MREIETDYLVVGAGATGMSFVDTLTSMSDVDVVMVDRRHRPGGHWLDAYPFVRLHQPSAYYGVNSRTLGADRIDEVGPNAGFYERATASEICDYFNRVLDELVGAGRLRFYAMSDYRGVDGDGHHFVSLLTGEETIVKVRRRFVDATYIESSIPSRHTPAYEVDDGVRLVSPNALVHSDAPATRYTIIGAGKTSMDTCSWLLENGTDPGDIRWVRKRDGWFFNRVYMQPLDLVGSYMDLQARWVEAASTCSDAQEFLHQLEDDGAFVRIDPSVEPGVFRGATISTLELDDFRSVEDVVRLGRVRRIGTDRLVLDGGELASEPNEVYVDCTAEGLRPTPARPVFSPDRLTMQWVTIGIAPWSAATIAAVEATHDDDTQKNALCPTLVWTGNAAEVLHLAHDGMNGLIARSSDPDVSAWNSSCRLDPAQAAPAHLDDPKVQEAFTSIAKNIGPALENLARVTRADG
jgi:hypothetical protein